MSTMWPRGCGASRRVLISSSDSTSRLMASLAAAISAADICAKSFFCSSSRSDTVSRASISTSRCVALELAQAREQRVLDALRARARLVLLARRRLRHQRGHQLVEIVAAAEEDAERLVEQLRVLVPLHEHRMQRPVEIRARADAGDAQGVERIEHRAGPDRNPGRAQRAREVDDVFRQSAVGHRRSHSAARSCVRTSSSSSFALVPSMRAMSS